MENVKFSLRNACREELPQLKAMCDMENWNHSLEHLQEFFDLNPRGNFVAVTDKGEVISFCGCTHLDDNTGFIAFYITKPEMRGKGIGQQVFDLVLNHLGDRNVALDAEADKQAMYASGRFKVSSFRKVSYKAALGRLANQTHNPLGVDFVNVNDVAFEKIKDFDQTFYPLERSTYLQAWFSTCVKSYAATKDGRVVGLGCLKAAAQGFRVAPLYANDAAIARMLWDVLVRDVSEDCQIEVIVPSDNSDAVQMFKDVHMADGVPAALVRMFTHKDIPVHMDKVYSACNTDSALV